MAHSLRRIFSSVWLGAFFGFLVAAGVSALAIFLNNAVKGGMVYLLFCVTIPERFVRHVAGLGASNGAETWISSCIINGLLGALLFMFVALGLRLLFKNQDIDTREN